MQKPSNVNSFLFIYLMLYLTLNLAGGLLLPSKLISILAQFLPLVLGLIYLKKTKQNFLNALNIRRVHPLTIPLAILLLFAIWPISSLASGISMFYSKNLISTTISGMIQKEGLFLSILSMALAPALIEEFTFRGIVFGQYRLSNRPMKAILLSSLCFGLFHMNFNQFTYAFLIGIFFALAVEASGSLITSMLMHFIFNGSNVFLSYLQSKVISTETMATTYSKTEILSTIKAIFPYAFVGLLLAILLLFLIAKINGRIEVLRHCFILKPSTEHDLDIEFKENQSLTNGIFYAFVAICLFMCFFIEYLK